MLISIIFEIILIFELNQHYHTMRYSIFLLLIGVSWGQLFASPIDTFSITNQILFTNFPTSMQLCVREKDQDFAIVKITGKVANSSNYDKVRLTVSSVENGMEYSLYYNLNTVGDSASFDFSYNLPANLINHKFTFYGLIGLAETKEMEVNKVVAGDVIIINGQSNAQAQLSPMPEDIVEFTRGYYNGKWGISNQSFPGKWGGHLANKLSQDLGYPIAIMNFAYGGALLSYFLKNPDDPNSGNYGWMLSLMAEAGVSNPSAVIWFQGESYYDVTTIESYKTEYLLLHESWKQDLGVDNSLMFQIRFQGCANNSPITFEAQRQLAKENDDIFIMSTTSSDHDSCHYHWENGYKVLAERMEALVLNKVYGWEINQDQYSANVDKVLLADPNTLKITFSPPGIPLAVIGYPSYDFKVEETGAHVINLDVNDDTLIVHLDSVLTLGQHFSYYSHSGSFWDWITSTSGVGILEFYNQEIQDIMVSNSQPQFSNDELTILPNPISDICEIRTHLNGPMDIQVVDMFGHPCFFKKQLESGSISLELSHLAKGVYTIFVHSKQDTAVGRIVLE